MPADWSDPAAHKKWSEPDFNEVDTPGSWSSYSFRLVFEQTTTNKGQKKVAKSITKGIVFQPVVCQYLCMKIVMMRIIVKTIQFILFKTGHFTTRDGN
eukprot:13259889-Ditylum_brightwellii.AAC.1